MTLNTNAQLLWKISGKGLTKPSYIIGTHHLATLSILDSIVNIRKVLKETEQVYGEVVMKDMLAPETMGEVQKAITITNDSTLNKLFTPEDYLKVQSFCQENLMFDIAQTPKIKPAYLLNNSAIAIYIKKVGQFKMNEQLDSFFQEQAITMNKKVGGLETYKFQFNILFNTPLKRQAEQFMCLLKHLDEAVTSLQNLTTAYMKQDLNEMMRINKKKLNDACDYSESEEDIMIYNRNKNWVEQFPQIMQEGSTLFAVGALHLPGEKGVLTLLKAKGYKVEPLK